MRHTPPREGRMPDGYSQIFRSYAFGPPGFWTMAPLCYAVKFAIWQPCRRCRAKEIFFSSHLPLRPSRAFQSSRRRNNPPPSPSIHPCGGNTYQARVAPTRGLCLTPPRRARPSRRSRRPREIVWGIFPPNCSPETSPNGVSYKSSALATNPNSLGHWLANLSVIYFNCDFQ